MSNEGPIKRKAPGSDKDQAGAAPQGVQQSGTVPEQGAGKSQETPPGAAQPEGAQPSRTVQKRERGRKARPQGAAPEGGQSGTARKKGPFRKKGVRKPGAEPQDPLTPADPVQPQAPDQKLKSKRLRRNKRKKPGGPKEFSGEDRDSFTSISSEDVSVKKPAPPPPTFTGFRELPVKDILVILCLWFIRFFIPWVVAWYEFTFHLLADPHYVETQKGYFTKMAILEFVGRCLLCMGFALLVDFINFRYPTFLVILVTYLSAPAAGVIFLALIVTRFYDRTYYYDYWHKTVVLMMWATSVPFIVFPLQMSCVFGQKSDMSRNAHYNWTAIFVLIELVNIAVAYWVIPPDCPTKYFTLFAVWAIILLLILILIVEGVSLLRWAKPEIKRWNLCRKRKDRPGTEIDTAPPARLRNRKLIWFSLMLVPVITTTVVHEFLKRTRPEEDWDRHRLITGTGMLACGQSIGVVFVVAVVFVFRKFGKKLQRFRVLKPDVLALGLPLLINVIALAVILARLTTLSSLPVGGVVLGPIPTDNVSIIEFFNVEFRNRTACVQSDNFGPLKVPPRQRVTAVIHPGDEIAFTVRLDPWTDPAIPTDKTFVYEAGVWVTYVIYLKPTQLANDDLNVYYNKLEALRVEGTAGIRPKEKAQVIIINTYVTIGRGFYFNSSYEGKTEVIQQVLLGQTIIREYPPSDVSITYWTTSQIKKLYLSPVEIKAESYCVYVILLCLYDKILPEDLQLETYPRSLLLHKTMQTAGPDSTRLPSKEELEKDLTLIVGMALAGMAYGGVYLGYLYLFWLDFPLASFRTTFLAGFWVVMGVPKLLEAVKVLEITKAAVTALMVLQALCTALHFGTSIFLYDPQLNFRQRSD